MPEQLLKVSRYGVQLSMFFYLYIMTFNHSSQPTYSKKQVIVKIGYIFLFHFYGLLKNLL